MEEAIKDALLPLDQPRQVVLRARERGYTYTLRRVTDKDWAQYFSGIVHQTLQVDGRRENVFETDSALIELVGAVLVSAEGYGDLSAIKDWKSALPFKHRVAVGIVLRGVASAPPSDDAPALAELVDVRLNGTWPTEGKSLLYEGLVHRFRHPSIEQLKRFNFEASRVKVRGTGENGVSIYPSRQLIAMKIYDELIEGVEGYGVNGEPLAGVDAIRREMDGAHKAAAALQLFVGEDEVEIE